MKSSRNIAVSIVVVIAIARVMFGSMARLSNVGCSENPDGFKRGGNNRSQYSIGYYRNHPVKDGKWHSVRIRMKNPDYVARARKEYLGK